ncbi:peptidoglycan-binding protein [Streptomyces sp. NPDC059452]|uniref:peptidoglycan-binding domain-containing protein n=1 Tax=Streptomyces sp. NPDC059452 TaxID=3346835 RepID=UPI0036C52F42
MRRLMAAAGAAIVLGSGIGTTGPALAAPTTARAVTTTATEAAPTGGAAAMAEYCTRALNSYRGSYIAKKPAGPTTYDCIMGQGAQGEHVRALQSALTLCHRLNTGGIDGIYGPATRSAVQALQRSVGLPVDGVYGPKTKSHVKWRYYSSSSAMCAS